MYTIKNKAGYIVITFSGYITFQLLLEALLKEMSLPDYPKKNDIWVFRKENTFLSQTAISAIVPVIRKLYPEHRERSKTAIVATNGFNSAVAALFTSEAGELPYEINVFGKMDPAALWVSR
jgi:hypothetical protein